MPAASYSDYARIMLALPGTCEELSKRVGMGQSGLMRILRVFWSLKLIHPGDVVTVPHHRIAVWKIGPGEAHPHIKVKPATTFPANQIAFAYVWRALEDGCTAHGISDQAGTAKVSAYRLLKLLRERKAVRICGWQRDALGRAVAVWALGAGANAPKPAPLPRQGTERFKRAETRKAFAILTRLGAANEEREAA